MINSGDNYIDIYRWRPSSYSGQFRIRYCDFACLYWLRFGYIIAGVSGVVGFTSPGSYNREPCTKASLEAPEQCFGAPLRQPCLCELFPELG